MKKKILIVEDDPKNMILFRDILQVKGYETAEATDGRQCLDMLKAVRPSLILMDIQMPEVDGIEATKQIKNDPESSDIPIIALTAFAMKGDEERIKAAGCDGYITKPIDVKEFVDIIEGYFK